MTTLLHDLLFRGHLDFTATRCMNALERCIVNSGTHAETECQAAFLKFVECTNRNPYLGDKHLPISVTRAIPPYPPLAVHRHRPSSEKP